MTQFAVESKKNSMTQGSIVVLAQKMEVLLLNLIAVFRIMPDIKSI